MISRGAARVIDYVAMAVSGRQCTVQRTEDMQLGLYM